MKRSYINLGIVSVVVMLVGFASATQRWTGAAGTTDWTTATNWDGNAVPDGSENVYISASGVNGTAVLSTTASGGTFGVGWYAGGTSTLTIVSGGDFSNTGTSTFGWAAGAKGTLYVNGGSFVSGDVSSDDLIVGNEGIGALSISNGGTVSAGDFYVGYATGGAGSLTVAGSGSTLTTAGGSFVVGRSTSTGSITISESAAVISAGTAYLGHVSSAVGDATVEGAGSLWDAATLLVGNTGQGSLTILDGGLVSVDSLSIDVAVGDAVGVIQMSTGGMLAVADGGTTASNLTSFLALIGGSTDNIEYWNGANWTHITNGTLNVDYTLTAYNDGATDYMKLTVGFAGDAEMGNISIAIDGSDAIISWTGTNGVSYALQSKGDLVADPSWSNEVTGISGTVGILSATSTTSAAESFYRVVVE